MKTKVITLLVALLFLVNCKNKEEKEQIPEIEVLNTIEEPQEEPLIEDATEATIVINSNDKMKYDKTELHAKEGQKVTLTLNHTGTMDKAVMGHNWVLLKQGTDIPAFAELAMKAKDNDYIPESTDIIVNTKTIGGGESATITFDAPAKGTYDFICSFPGHYGVMKGKFIVE